MKAVAGIVGQAKSCLVCGETRAERRFVQRGYPVYRCVGCGLEFVSPTPSAEELAAYYDRSYAVPLDRYAAAGRRNAARIAELERWCPGRGYLLEIGASYGHSLVSARERGWKVAGVELSPTAAEYARNHFGLNVFNCDLADAPVEREAFDAVVMWHVLEHVRNPKAQLLTLAGLLKPGGVLGLRVPNIASFGARMAGQWWPWMCPPAHLWFFSPGTLPRLLQECGFEVSEVRTLRGDGNNLYQYMLMAAGNRLNELRLRLHGTTDAASPSSLQTRAPEATTEALVHDAAPHAAVLPSEGASKLLQAWLAVLSRAQPITDAVARGTRWLIEPLERRGLGDELLVYARRK